MRTEYGRVDGLVNDAAIHYDTWQRAIDADLGTVQEALDTNLLGAWRATLTLLPLLRASSSARVVNVSSGAGSLSGMGGGTPAYRVSKAALNALTRTLAAELSHTGILVNAVCPGWVATDMGGPGGRARRRRCRPRPVGTRPARLRPNRGVLPRRPTHRKVTTSSPKPMRGPT